MYFLITIYRPNKDNEIKKVTEDELWKFLQAELDEANLKFIVEKIGRCVLDLS